LSVGDKEALGAQNLGLAVNLGGLIFFDCVTMKLIARIGGIMVSPLVLHQLDMDHFRECLKRSATWMAQGPTSLMPRQPLKRPDAKTLPGRQRVPRDPGVEVDPCSPFQVWSDRYPYFWKHLHSGKLT